ncbi:MAG TPA: BamA/TamA family outer membrane protein [Thermoanaerobaculia bacterium]|nr:BamA/TamA family outer membrane protein [Thermoanaerobaculia bacterium]
MSAHDARPVAGHREETMSNRSPRIPLITLTLILLAAFAVPADAQYFGRNKVQWESFDFRVLKTEHFDIYYYDDAAPVIEDIGRMSERWYERLSTVFQHEFERKPIVIYANHPDFQQTNTTSGFIGEGTGGFTDPFMNRVVLPLTGTYEETDHVLGHELVHVFQFDIASRFSGGNRRFQLRSLPLWMIEGLAEYLTQGRFDPQTAMWIRDATIRDDLPTPEKLMRDPRLSPYQYGQAFWAYIGGRWSDQAVIETFLASGFLGIEGGIQQVLGVPSSELFADWHAAARTLYEPVITDRWGPDRLGDPILPAAGRSNIDISPSLSPDGRWLAFLSTRELFSIDLFLADARTGEVKGRLVSTASNPHFDALRFIDSAGTWSPDSRKLAFVTIEKGDNRIAVVDVESRRIEQRFEVPGISGITQIAWSPDGRTLAISGMKGGVSDLYLWDIASKQLTQITNDRNSDLQPAWSPDGRFVAVVSDRGAGTDFGPLIYERHRISIIDVATREVRILDLFPGGVKHINPQFSPDGTKIYFIADPDGISDIFRYDLASGAMERLTNVATGVAGITDLSPALTVAARTGEVMFSYFRGGSYRIYRGSQEEARREVMVAESGVRGALLPPPAGSRTSSVASTVTAYLDEPDEGLLPASVEFGKDDYSPRLRLSYVGPPSFGVGFGGDYGTSYGGTFAAMWTDILGDHQVGLTLSGGASTGDLGNLFAGEVFYLNLKNRVQWGGAASHFPYITGGGTFYRQEEVDVGGGQTALADVYDRRLDRVTVDDVLLLSRYPLGTTRRLELNGGFTNLSYSSELESYYYVGNSFLGTTRDSIDTFPSIGYARAQTAFVGDSSFYGFISPISGTRYRYQAEAYTGDLNFQTGLADWRRYFFNRPWTLAVRGYVYGRFGEGAEDPRLPNLFLGYPSLVRGYEANSFNGSECTPAAGGSCPEFERLFGSKIAVGGIELRVPLFGTEEFGLFEAPFFPTELVGFVDVGAAWNEDESVTWEFDRDTPGRVPVASAGVAARVLLGGYLPLQFYYAFPFQRPAEEGGVFGFTISPGW